jgi:hypothetical protein
MKTQRLVDGRERVVRHGHGPERLVQTGIGPVAVQRVKLRDRNPAAASERIRFTSAILPRWARRTPSLDALLPILYLRGVSMGDFQEALAALLGKDAPNLSPSVIARLRGEWEADHARWQRRDLSARRYVYIWADGVYLQARMEPQAECMLVMIGATPEGKKELPGASKPRPAASKVRRRTTASSSEFDTDFQADGVATKIRQIEAARVIVRMTGYLNIPGRRQPRAIRDTPVGGGSEIEGLTHLATECQPVEGV